MFTDEFAANNRAPVEDELSTIPGATVIVHQSGAVTVKRVAGNHFLLLNSNKCEMSISLGWRIFCVIQNGFFPDGVYHLYDFYMQCVFKGLLKKNTPFRWFLGYGKATYNPIL